MSEILLPTPPAPNAFLLPIGALVTIGIYLVQPFAYLVSQGAYLVPLGPI